MKQIKTKLKRLIDKIVCIASIINNISITLILLMLLYDLVIS